MKPTNPKDAIGSDKLPLHLWPTTATALGSIAMLNGALKYGRSNFRAIGVRASIYYDAARRHLDAWFEGEENDPDDGVPHLGAALACIAILVDSDFEGSLNDDRAYPGGYRDAIAALTPHVSRLKALHAARNPEHYTIESPDVEQTGDDVLQKRAQQDAAGLAVSSQDAQPVRGGDTRRLVFGVGEGLVGGVQVPDTSQAQFNVSGAELKRLADTLAGLSKFGGA